MCGFDDTTRQRGGALAALTPPLLSASPLRADLAFHTPGLPRSQTATHARLTPDSLSALHSTELSVVIHALGDLTARHDECGTFHRFVIPAEHASVVDRDAAFVEVVLPDPISIAVGGPGIIGRRVSLFSRRVGDDDGDDGMLIAEGIVGFNI